MPRPRAHRAFIFSLVRLRPEACLVEGVEFCAYLFFACRETWHRCWYGDHGCYNWRQRRCFYRAWWRQWFRRLPSRGIDGASSLVIFPDAGGVIAVADFVPKDDFIG